MIGSRKVFLGSLLLLGGLVLLPVHAKAITKSAPPVVAASQKVQLYRVTSVVDGDTFKVRIGSKVETVRVIGIDTPETVYPRKPVQCFGKEASQRAKLLLSGKRVQLEAEKSQGDRDKYGRLLRNVVLDNGTSFGEGMIRDGYAHEYTYRLPYKLQSAYKAVEKAARGGERGLWANGACGAPKAATKPPPAPVTSTPLVTPPPAIALPGSSIAPLVTPAQSQPNATVGTSPETDPDNTREPEVKMSSTSICHARGSTYYLQTKKFTPYASISACLEAGGRLPKR